MEEASQKMMMRMTTSMPHNIRECIREQKMLKVGMPGAGNIEPQPVVKIKPFYPREALAAEIEGYCIVEFWVTVKGTTTEHKIIECSPSDIFALSSILTVKQFLYMPALNNWVPSVRPGIRNKITFEIEGKTKPSN